MKHSWIIKTLFIFIIFLTACKQEKPNAGQKIAFQYHDNGKVRVEAEVINDTVPHGILKEFSRDGYLESVYTYAEGRREGPSVKYYVNGNLKLKTYYKNNRRSGLTKMYYKSGELYRTINYIRGKEDGMRNTYYKDGSLMGEAPYKDGYPGLGLKEYHKNGSPDVDDIRINVIPVNKLAFEDKYEIRLSLSEPRPSSRFYVGELVEDQYLHRGLWPVTPRKDGTGTYTIELSKGSFAMRTLTISAVYQTEKSNLAVISRKYNLAIDNK